MAWHRASSMPAKRSAAAPAARLIQMLSQSHFLNHLQELSSEIHLSSQTAMKGHSRKAARSLRNCSTPPLLVLVSKVCFGSFLQIIVSAAEHPP